MRFELQNLVMALSSRSGDIFPRDEVIYMNPCMIQHEYFWTWAKNLRFFRLETGPESVRKSEL